MKHDGTSQFDSRDAVLMYEYMEAWIDTLKRRIMALEAENAALRHGGFTNVNPAFAASA